MKTVLLFGAGKSATVLIDYLLENAITGNWKVFISYECKSIQHGAITSEADHKIDIGIKVFMCAETFQWFMK